jgi:hypothetical protein
MRKSLLLGLLAGFVLSTQQSAVGCDLNNPDSDVGRLFPDATGYRIEYLSIAARGGDSLLSRIEARLGDKFQGLFETKDVPYIMYRVYRDAELIGYINGVSQKGKYGGLQVFLALDTAGTIRDLYFQKLTSRAAGALRQPSFGRQFVGLSLRDFYRYDVASGTEPGGGRIAGLHNPAPETDSDFRAVLRAVKKNLILVDEFLLRNRHLKYFSR